jgi:hypothetical protein
MDEPDVTGDQGEIPDGVGPEIFREHLRRAVAGQGPEHGAHILLEEETVFLEDIEAVEAEPESPRSRVRLRNGLIITGVTGAAIAAALAAVRFKQRHHP